MIENHELNGVGLATPAENLTEPTTAVAEAPVPVETNGTPVPERTGDWHVEAGRKGAYRIRELIHYGKMYEQEHGLKSGRQRLRQLIEEGKQYEQEHGLRPASKQAGRRRGPRMSKQESLRTFLNSLVRLVKPGLRSELTRLLEDLERKPSGV